MVRLPALVAVLASLAVPLEAQHRTEEFRSEKVFVFRGGPGAALRLSTSHLEGAHLGVTTLDMTEELRAHFGVSTDRGVLVSSVLEDSPAGRAGIRVADIVAQLDGQPVSGSLMLAAAIGHRQPSDRIELVVVRDGTTISSTIELGEATRRRLDLSPLLLEAPVVEGRFQAMRGEPAPVLREVETEFAAPLGLDALLTRVSQQLEDEAVRQQLDLLLQERDLLRLQVEKLETRLERLESDLSSRR